MRASTQLSTLLTAIVTDMGFSWPAKVTIEPSKDKKFGDLAVNLALVLAKEAGKQPRALAEELAQRLRAASSDISLVEVAGPGFLNVTFAPAFWQSYVPLVEEAGERYGASEAGKGQKGRPDV